MPSPIDLIAAAIRNAIGGAIKDSADTLDTAAEKAGEGTGTAVQGLFDGGFSLDDLLLLIPGVGEVLTLPGGVLSGLFGKAGKFIEGIAAGWLLGSLFTEIARPVYLELVHAVQDQVQTEIFDPQTAAKLAAARIITTDFAHSEAAGGNLDGSHTDHLIDAAQTRPDIGTLFDALNRGEVGESDVRSAMQRHGMPDFWIDPVLNLRRQLLSPADLALGFLRGHIEQPFMYSYGATLGVDQADMDVLVENTGEPPGPQELMEALRRGFIDQSRFERGIRQSRIRNEWIDVEDKLRFSPMSVADAVRAVVENYLTSDQGKEIAMQNGLREEDWPIMVESFGRPLSHEQMMMLYFRGKVTLDQVHQAFRESDLKDKYIDQAVELARRLVPERTIVLMLEHGAIDDRTAHTMLSELGFNTTDADNLIKTGTSAKTSAHKTFSRSDIVAMYTDSLLTRRDAHDHLVSLGYPDSDATALLDLADVKAKAKILRSLQSGVEASFKAGHLNEQQALNSLEHAGMDHQQAQMLVDEWKQIKGKATRNLTEAQILKLGKEQLLSPPDVLSRLQAYGLSEGDATLLMEMDGVIPVPGQAPPPAATPPPPPATP